jgi:outer membrane protein OmpA-like peptidoglycan-associated protein
MRCKQLFFLSIVVFGLAITGCAKKSTLTCAPIASWSLPASSCAAPSAIGMDMSQPPTEAAAVEPPAAEPVAAAPAPEPAAALKGDSIELRDTVQFQSGKALLLPASESLLDEVVAILNAHPELTKLSIEGHTDSQGSDKNNKSLSKARAQAVRDYFVGKGIVTGRLTAAGLGESKPIADNNTDDGRFKNRRVEFKVIQRK